MDRRGRKGWFGRVERWKVVNGSGSYNSQEVPISGWEGVGKLMSTYLDFHMSAPSRSGKNVVGGSHILPPVVIIRLQAADIGVTHVC